MKKYISFILCVVLLLSSIVVKSEGNESTALEDASMSIEIINNDAESEDTQNNDTIEDVINSDENNEVQETGNDDKYIETEHEEDNAFSLMSASSSDGWSRAAYMNTQRADCELLTIGNDLYAIAGMGMSGYLNTIEKYNLDANVWETVTEIPNTAKGFGVVANGSKIYIIGGYDGSDYLNTVQIYDVISNSWDEMTPMNEKRDQPATLYMDNKLYVFGGRNVGGFVNSYEYYDFLNNAWYTVTTGFSETMIRVGAHAQYIGGYICMYGGIDNDYSYAGVDMYSSNDMKQFDELIGDGYDEISIAWGADKALIFAWDRNKSTYDVHEMTVSNGDVSIEEVIFTNTAIACKYSKYIIYNGYLYAVGGYNTSSKKYLETVNKYSVYYGDYAIGDGTINSVVTADGNSITLNVEAGREYILIVNTNNISSFAGYVFSLEYPNDSFSLVDGCAMTSDKETEIGAVTGTDIVITENSSDGVSFICTEMLNGIDKVSKSINAVILKANSTGQRTIRYSMVRG